MRLDINTLVGQLAAERDIEPEKLIDAVAERLQAVLDNNHRHRQTADHILTQAGGSTILDCLVHVVVTIKVFPTQRDKEIAGL